MNKKVDEYEKDRIGQGNFVGQNLGIGGMNSAQKAQEYLKGGEKAPQPTNIKSLKNSMIMFPVEAPNTFLTPTSLVR